MKAQIAAVRKNGFLRSAGVLVGGTAFAQALAVLALPLLTRLYSPEDFSLLAVYVALLTLVSVIACLRLEIAIPLPEDDTEAANLLAIALTLVAVTAAIVALIVLAFGTAFFDAIGQPRMAPYGWLLPPAVLLAGSYAALQYWATRKKRFPTIARTRMMQAASGITAQIGLGWIGAGALGLMIGHALKAGSGVVNLTREALRSDMGPLSGISRIGMLRALGEYRAFPQYSVWEALFNQAAVQIPMLLIAALAVGPEAGFLLLAMRAMGTPVQLVGRAASQVYLSRAPEEMRRGNLPGFTTEVLSGLARAGAPIIIFIGVVAPTIFPLVFGEEWRRAGELVAWMTPWYLLKLLSSPISMVMHVTMKQKSMMALMIAMFFVSTGVTLAAYALHPSYIAIGYALSGMASYAVALTVYLLVSGTGLRAISRLARSATGPVLAALVGGIILTLVLAQLGV